MRLAKKVMKFRKVLRMRLKYRDVREIAEEVGVSHTTVCRWISSIGDLSDEEFEKFVRFINLEEGD